jgi:hypothetical protein
MYVLNYCVLEVLARRVKPPKLSVEPPKLHHASLRSPSGVIFGQPAVWQTVCLFKCSSIYQCHFHLKLNRRK